MNKRDKILIVCQHGTTPRLNYILKTLIVELAGMDYILTDNRNDIHDYQGACIIYGNEPMRGAINIYSCGLLFETGINSLKPEVQMWNGTPVLFKTGIDDFGVPFDIFSASFWLLSRYEEYQDFEPDKHGRFHSGNSLLAKHGLLQTPLVNQWLEILLDFLEEKSGKLNRQPDSYRFIPTIDIDSAWAYRHKPPLRQIGGLAKAAMKFNVREATERLKVRLRLSRDPFDTFGVIEEIHAGKEKPIIFFLLGRYSKHNKNPSPRNRCYRALIRKTESFSYIGIHPSYETYLDATLLKAETDTLADIVGRPVRRSRQHFLRIQLPETFRALIRAGIREDYSMGFADVPGFRAGTCHPFRFYDLPAEEETDLKVFPLALMDGTLRDYSYASTEEGTAIIRELADTARRHHGVFVTLWHNESLSEKKRWRGWLDVYRKSVEYCSEID